MAKVVRVGFVVAHRIPLFPIRYSLFFWFKAIIKVMLSITRFACYPITHPIGCRILNIGSPKNRLLDMFEPSKRIVLQSI